MRKRKRTKPKPIGSFVMSRAEREFRNALWHSPLRGHVQQIQAGHGVDFWIGTPPQILVEVGNRGVKPDPMREHKLRSLGVRLIRFMAAQAECNPTKCVLAVLDALHGRGTRLTSLKDALSETPAPIYRTRPPFIAHPTMPKVLRRRAGAVVEVPIFPVQDK